MFPGKRRITIPREVADLLNIREGDYLSLRVEGNKLILEKIDPIDLLKGFLAKKGPRRVWQRRLTVIESYRIDTASCFYDTNVIAAYILGEDERLEVAEGLSGSGAARREEYRS